MSNLDTSQKVESKVFEGANYTYSMLTVTLVFRRRTLFFSFNLILPTLIITVCTTFGFLLPPEGGEKIGLRNNFS